MQKKSRLCAPLSACCIGILLLFSGHFSLHKSAQTKEQNEIAAGAPKSHSDIRFENKIFDFGKIMEGDKEEIEHVFRFKNVGKGPLKIERITSTCGCAAALLSKKEIPPGGEGEIKVTFKTKRRVGRQKKRVTVYSNDPKESRIQLIMTGFILPIFKISPSRLIFGSHAKEELKSKTTEILSGTGEPFTITKVELEKKGPFEVSQKPLTGRKVGYHIEVRLKEDSTAGIINDTLKIHTDNKRMPMVPIRIFGELSSDIRVEPPVLAFGSLLSGKEVKKTIIVSSISKKEDLKILDIENEYDCVICELTELEKGKKFEISVTVQPDALPENRSSIRDIIKIQTNSDIQPYFKVPIYAHALRKKRPRAHPKGGK